MKMRKRTVTGFKGGIPFVYYQKEVWHGGIWRVVKRERPNLEGYYREYNERSDL